MPARHDGTVSAVLRFVARRLIQMVVTMVVATFVFYAAFTVLPGDPVRALFGEERPPPALYERVREEYRLDEPFLVQYGSFAGGLLRGDLGHSYPDTAFGTSRQGPAVRGMLESSVPVSARLLGITVLVQVVLGLWVGTSVTLRRRTKSGTALYATTIGLAALPVVVVAILVRAVLGLRWGWLPAYWRPVDDWRNYVVPVVALSAGAATFTALLARGELLTALRTPFVRAAAANGVPPGRLVRVHAMRPSLVALVAFVTGNLANLVTGLIVVEGIYSVPGVGGQIFAAIQAHDRAFLVPTITLILMLVIVANTLSDIAHAMLDPRTRLDR